MTRPRPAGPPTLRRHNLGLVLAALRGVGSASRAELAARTGLTRATVATLLEPLLDAGVLAEDAATPRGVGRPSRALRFDPDGPVALGVAVDVETLAVCAVGLDGAVRALRQVERDHRRLPPAAVFDGAAAFAAELRSTVGARVLGVGLALPALLGSPADTSATPHADVVGGPVSPAGPSPAEGADGARPRAPVRQYGPLADTANPAVVLRAPNLPRLVGALPAAELAGRLRLPVTVGNEAQLGALAHLDIAPDLVYVSAGIGIGGGVVLNGRVYRGVHGLAGELGHVVVERDGPACGCGGLGCVERFAGATALLADAGAADLDALERLLAGGDRRATAATARSAAALGVGLASVLNVLDVPVVVLGGTYAHLARYAVPAVRAELRRRTLQPEPVRVLVSDKGDSAVVRGAAESVLDDVRREPDRLLA